MINKLNKLLKTKTMCEIYADTNNTDKFIVGYVSGVDDEFCLITNFDYYGNYDGIICLTNNDIYRIQTNTRYITAIKKLMGKKNNLIVQSLPAKDILNTVINQLANSKSICQIELCDSEFVTLSGIIKTYDCQRGIVELELIDDYGDSDGETIIDVQTVNLITYDSLDTKRLSVLMSK